MRLLAPKGDRDAWITTTKHDLGACLVNAGGYVYGSATLALISVALLAEHHDELSRCDASMAALRKHFSCTSDVDHGAEVPVRQQVFDAVLERFKGVAVVKQLTP